MTVKLPEKAGFMPTPDEWDALVRIAENLGAQVVQRDAALARVERERAELIETVARLRAECNDAQAVARAYILRAERAEAEAVRLTAEYTLDDAAVLRQPAPAQPDATMLSDNSLQTSSQAPANGQG